jgi:hypothetical protein
MRRKLMERYRRSLVELSESLNALGRAKGREIHVAMVHVAAAQIELEQAKTALLTLD